MLKAAFYLLLLSAIGIASCVGSTQNSAPPLPLLASGEDRPSETFTERPFVAPGEGQPSETLREGFHEGTTWSLAGYRRGAETCISLTTETAKRPGNRSINSICGMSSVLDQHVMQPGFVARENVTFVVGLVSKRAAVVTIEVAGVHLDAQVLSGKDLPTNFLFLRLPGHVRPGIVTARAPDGSIMTRMRPLRLGT